MNKELGLEIKVIKTKYILLSRYKNANKILDIKVADRLFESLSQLKYFSEPRQEIKI